MQLLSLVVPCFNEEATIQTFYDEVMKYEDRIDAELEFCFIDDGSTDRRFFVIFIKKIPGFIMFLFPETSGKKQGFMPGFLWLRETM